MSEARLEGIVHVVVAKPIAWTLYLSWLALKWVGRSAAKVGRRAWSRWIEFRQKRAARRSSLA